jgi:hypothetical protein
MKCPHCNRAIKASTLAKELGKRGGRPKGNKNKREHTAKMVAGRAKKRQENK